MQISIFRGICISIDHRLRASPIFQVLYRTHFSSVSDAIESIDYSHVQDYRQCQSSSEIRFEAISYASVQVANICSLRKSGILQYGRSISIQKKPEIWRIMISLGQLPLTKTLPRTQEVRLRVLHRHHGIHRVHSSKCTNNEHCRPEDRSGKGPRCEHCGLVW